jgi:hypothetical protein
VWLPAEREKTAATTRVRWEEETKARTQVTSNNWTNKHTNATKQIIEWRCKAKTSCWDKDLI